jgi:hypothetical protein
MKLLWYITVFPSIFALVNVTVDNKYGDPRTGNQFVYSPNGAWMDGPGCTTCQAQPDPSLAYDHTWIEGFFSPQVSSNPFPDTVMTASINFTGVFLEHLISAIGVNFRNPLSGNAVYVFCVRDLAFGTPDLMFFVDGELVGTHRGVGERLFARQNQYDYNVLVYSNQSLSAGMHSLTMQNGVPNGNQSLVLFDYLTYS